MTATAVIALALAAQNCPLHRPGPEASPCRVYVGDIIPPDEGNSIVQLDAGSTTCYAGGADGYVHESGQRMTLAAAAWRRARYCATHHKGPFVVLGGLPPDDFAMAAALAPITPPSPLRRALVHRGLAAAGLATRDAAQRALVAGGTDSISALLGGLTSADAEVAWRCKLILEELRVGPDPGPLPASPAPP
jgi:hypothetical protein